MRKLEILRTALIFTRTQKEGDFPPAIWQTIVGNPQRHQWTAITRTPSIEDWIRQGVIDTARRELYETYRRYSPSLILIDAYYGPDDKDLISKLCNKRTIFRAGTSNKIPESMTILNGIRATLGICQVPRIYYVDNAPIALADHIRKKNNTEVWPYRDNISGTESMIIEEIMSKK